MIVAREEKKELLKNINLLPNNVLIKITNENDTIRLSDNTELQLATNFNEQGLVIKDRDGRHLVRYGEVVAVCDSLHFSRDINDRRGMLWKTELEIQNGDIAYFDFMASYNSIYQDDTAFRIDNQLYIIINYQYIIAVKRNEQLIPVNGYILCQPIPHGTIDSIIELDNINSISKKPNIMIYKKNKYYLNIFRVKYVGKRNEEYLSKDFYDTDEEIKENDIIMTEEFCNLPLEYEIHKSLSEELYRVQRYNIISILNL